MDEGCGLGALDKPRLEVDGGAAADGKFGLGAAMPLCIMPALLNGGIAPPGTLGGGGGGGASGETC